MKTLMNNLKKKLNRALIRLQNTDGQFVMDHAVVFVIIIVVGALVLGLLKTFVGTDLAPVLKEKILAFFN